VPSLAVPLSRIRRAVQSMRSESRRKTATDVVHRLSGSTAIVGKNIAPGSFVRWNARPVVETMPSAKASAESKA
jgi:hypothetical protein